MATVGANRLVVQVGQAPIVVVANLRKRPIGTGIGQHELEHLAQALAHQRRNGKRVALGEQHARIPELGDEPLIADALLEIDPVRVDLVLHLAPDDRLTLRAPGRRVLQLGQQDPEKQQADAVGQVVVAVVVGILEVVQDVPTMLQHGFQETSPELKARPRARRQTARPPTASSRRARRPPSPGPS